MEKFTFDGRQIFHQFGLEVADDIRCHKANLIIGKNGSGKTRLLKAIEKIYRQKEPEKFEVVTLYFPEINSFFTPSSGEESEEGYTAELGASIFSGESMSFQDFLKLAQRDNISPPAFPSPMTISAMTAMSQPPISTAPMSQPWRRATPWTRTAKPVSGGPRREHRSSA